MAYPVAKPASKEYTYMDPKDAPHAITRLPEVYHPLDAWNTLGHDPPLKSPYYTQIFLGFATGTLVAIVGQWSARRPLWSQGWRHVMWGSIGVGLTLISQKFYKTRQARRDAVIQHYLETHYDDFPLIRRRKIKDEFRTWHPSR